MRAFVHEGNAINYTAIEDPVVKSGQVLIRMKVSGLNHRDLKIPQRRGDDRTPLILGSDGAGIIEEVGDAVTNYAIGDEVIINPGLGWKENSDAPPEGFQIVGMPDHGTFAEKMVIEADYIEKKPSHLTWEQAGVLALSALTGYRALFTKAQVKKGDTVFIPGAGSGVATFILQFAKAVGARVIVSSRSEEKRDKAVSLGAVLAIDTNENWHEQLRNEMIDVVIDSVGSATFNRSLAVLKKGGKLVTFGSSTEDEVTLNLRQFFYGQYQLLGSTMGSRQELREMLEFVDKHQIKPVVDAVFQLTEAKKAFDYLQESKQFGKIAIQISPI
ncbi:zinc-binding dehydrogenase [Aquibacillus koreensis]|uniref:Zinc-binding dehydrogenase n=1 Tax=Aquibacillus koreensis TaxID=279446 RepID=A0A9X3WL37_9BACI|nr:zinc-binding dehydrogenase [Aquibacillus koreensis]MCT2534354.1 zinc-binding dehydrogenase [Aquibacillus koreensis]MDC3420675.1 zinc-binding dehydrogenase [Aquibacillus koreensis]